MRLLSEKDSCIFCKKKAEDAYSITNRVFQLCDRCRLLIDLITNGLDKGFVKKGESVDEEDLPFYDEVEEKMIGGVLAEALLPFDDTPVRNDSPVFPEQIPFDDVPVTVVSDTKNMGKRTRKNRKRQK